MKTFIIYLPSFAGGGYVENFTKKSICVTDNKNRAGKYSFKIANKRLSNFNITEFNLIEII